MQKNHLGQAGGQKASGKAKPQMNGWSEEDAERLVVRNWRIKAKDRDGWRLLLESAKALHGL